MAKPTIRKTPSIKAAEEKLGIDCVITHLCEGLNNGMNREELCEEFGWKPGTLNQMIQRYITRRYYVIGA